MSSCVVGGPLWSRDMGADDGGRKICRNAFRLQRQLALRVIRGYRTISHETSLLLAHLVPFELLANRLRRRLIRHLVLD